MKLSVPEELNTPLAMLMKGIPEELREDEDFINTALVYLKFGGIRLARQYVETRKKFNGFDPLEIDTGFRFPRLQETETEEENQDENGDDVDQEDDDDGDERLEDDD